MWSKSRQIVDDKGGCKKKYDIQNELKSWPMYVYIWLYHSLSFVELGETKNPKNH